MSYAGSLSEGGGGGSGRLRIETALATYTLTSDEIDQNPIVFFTDEGRRNSILKFPLTFDSGRCVTAYQSFAQGLGYIEVQANFLDPVIVTYSNPDTVDLTTFNNSKVNINKVEETIVAFATVNPNLFIDNVTAELTSYVSRYRMRVFNTGNNKIQIGLDSIPIETWVDGRLYGFEATQAGYIPGLSTAYVIETRSFSGGGGQAPEGGKIELDWTRVSNNTTTTNITTNNNGSFTFLLKKKPIFRI